VQNARFGACLMAEPELVARCVAAMAAAADLPVTVKTRTGIDQRDSYAELRDFVGTVAAAGCRSFTIHARKAWLRGLSPKQNREVPPLDYDRVYRLKADFPELEILINGGVRSLDEAEAHVRALLPYAVEQCAQGVPIKSIARHTLGLFNGLPGARAWRRHLSEAAHRPGAGPEVIEDALDVVRAQLEARGVAA
jgi:tRNA-dihydrouridine synthase A